MTIAEIKGLDDGTVIPPFTATLKYVNDHKGKSQSFKLEDSTGEITLQRISTSVVGAGAKGKQVQISKGKAEDSTYNGKTNRRVVLFSNGSFELQGSESPKAPEVAVSQGNGHVAEAAKPVNGNGKKASSFFQGFLHDYSALMIAAYVKGEISLEHFASKEYAKGEWTYVSDRVRTCDLIESGKLAPSPKDRDPVVEEAKQLFQAEEEDDWAKVAGADVGA